MIRTFNTFAVLWLCGALCFVDKARADRTVSPAFHLPTSVSGIGGYAFEVAFPGVPPVNLVGITSAPGDTNRLFYVDKTGVIWVITNLASPNLSTFLDLSARTTTDVEAGLTGLAFHPNYQNNGQFFVFYSTQTNTSAGAGLHERISRFQVDPNNPNAALVDSEVPLITQYDRDPEHQGGTMLFGPDGYLYVGVGDEGGSFDIYGNSQRIDGNFFSAILRLDVDGRPGNLPPNSHPAVNPQTAYWIPADNPFIGVNQFGGHPVQPESVRTEFYAVGFRNPFRFSFDASTGQLFVNDVGQNRREEVNLVRPGGNYGWSFFEGTLPNPFLTNTAPTLFEPPIFEYEHQALRIAITSALVYRGTKFPELNGAYLFSDYAGSMGILRQNALGQWQNEWQPEDVLPSSVTDLMIQPGTDDVLAAVNLSGVAARLIRRPTGGDSPPAHLSETGVFADVLTLTPAPGLEPYEVNVPFWSDGAHKQRWFALPATNLFLGYTNAGAWTAPVGTVWVKHFDLDVVTNSAVAPFRIETRLLVRTDSGVYGLSYRWRPDQTDADLVPREGLDVAYPVLQSGTNHLQTWHYPGRAECASCHNSSAGFSLGFNTPQLNRQILRNNQWTNQIEALASAGYFSNPPVQAHLDRSLAALDDASTSVEWRVRSYLAANCAACHMPSGPTRATWDARPVGGLSDLGIVGVPAIDDIADPSEWTTTYIVSPGDLESSALYRRVADAAPYHMPPLATSEINQAVVPLLASWVTNDLTKRLTYTNWANQYFPTNGNAALASPNADPSNSGLPNEARWLLQLNPTDPTSTWTWGIVLKSDGPHLQYVRKAGVAFQIETTVSLGSDASWRLLNVPGNEWRITSEDTAVDLALPTSNDSNCFYRVAISEP